MTFEARVYIQGVGIYVPHETRDELLVLFPDQERASARGLRDFRGKEVCEHHAVVQFRTQEVESSGATLDSARLGDWTTIYVDRHWIGFSTTPETEETRLFDQERRVVGVPYLPGLLAEAHLNVSSRLDEGVWPNDLSEPELVRAGVVVGSGILSPASDYEGRFRFFRSVGRELAAERNTDDRTYSSVLKVELGEVDELRLKFRPFDSQEISIAKLRSRTDELELWIRHFCNLEQPPDLGQDIPGPEDREDPDFALNYALLAEWDELSGHPLPFPRVSSSWARGGPIGDRPRRCLGSSSASSNYKNPLG